ncbi:MAG: phosphoribosylglycinamide formyltransferase [Verrucomicrobiaceae bacterium]
MKKIAVLGSGTGSNFSALLDSIESGDLHAQITLVISDQPHAGILQKAEAANIASAVEVGGPDLSARIATRLGDIDLICLAGFMRLIKEPLLSAFPNRILNIHPSLLPKYPGLEAWRQALDDGAAETGCTVHYVDAGMDTGKTILQEKVAILPNDTPASLHARIQQAEHRIYPAAVRKVLESL